MEIDIHTHVFNSSYLPLKGILRSWGVPKILAGGVAAVFEWNTNPDPDLRTENFFLGVMAELPTEDDVPELPDESLVHEEILAVSEEEIIEQISKAAEQEPGLFLDPRMLEAAEFLRNEQPGDSIPAAEFFGPAAMFSPLEATQRSGFVKRLLEKAFRGIVGSGRLIKWLWFITLRETAIYRTLKRTYSADLFVHHMMDMESHYSKTKPEYELPKRVEFMRRLEKYSKGRLVGFFAYDPYRPDGVELAKRAVTGGGFCGVKIYPPSGYRPTGNAGHDAADKKMGIKRPITGEELDGRNQDLFEFCARNEVPVFTHCTPGGFERVKGKSGKFSDPHGWRSVLEQNNSLRLCLGHAGGGKGWFAKGDDFPDFSDEAYAVEVYNLCVDPNFPNVVCGMGYLDEILRDEEVGSLRARLERLLDPNESHSAERFGRSILYGSDWHMLYKEVGQENYLDAFREMFNSSPILSGHADAFFSGNAARYLNLNRHLEANAGALSDDEQAHLRKILDQTSGA